MDTKNTKFFAKAKKVEQSINAEGYVGNRPHEKQNGFEFSGTFCKK